MNVTILQKCVEELKKDNPNISYIQGMLETLIELDGANRIRDWTPMMPSQPTYPLPTPYVVSNEADEVGSGLLAQYERGPVAPI